MLIAHADSSYKAKVAYNDWTRQGTVFVAMLIAIVVIYISMKSVEGANINMSCFSYA